MSHSASSHCDRVLQTWRDEAGFASWAAFCRATGLSRYRVAALRNAQLERLPVSDLVTACKTLNRQMQDYVNLLESGQPLSKSDVHLDARTSERDEEQWQRQTLDRLEPLMRQYPTAKYAAERRDLLARNVLALLHPLEQLLEDWHVQPIERVGAVVPFNPTQHQMLSDDAIAPGDPVEIRYVGYFVRETLWLKAQVRVPKS